MSADRQGMAARERFRRWARFEPVDCPFRCETLGFWGETIERWRKEGLPDGVSGESFFAMDRWEYYPVNAGFTHLPYLPQFEHAELERTDRHVIFRGGDGIVRKQKVYQPGTSMPQWLRFPMESRADWDDIVRRLDPDDPSRYPDPTTMHAKYDARTHPLGIVICGAYGTPRNLFGEANLAYVYYDDPDLIHEIMEWWVHFYTRVVSTVTANYAGLDFFLIWEDMAHKTGPLISPEFVKKFMMPYYERLIDHVRSCGIECIWLDTDGNANSLADMFVGAGVSALCPFEIAAGMEPLPARKKYGRKLAIMGGIDKRAVIAGGEIMRAEVMRKVPALLEGGGYIPGIDHATPPDTPFANHREFVNLIRELGLKYGGG